MPATATGAHVYGEGTVSYTLTKGSSDTKLYNEKLAGGTSPEILISKSNGSFKVSGIPTGNAAAATVTFKLNNDYVTVIPSTGVTVREDASFENKVKTVVIDIAAGTSSFDLEFKNTSNSNCRADNFSVVVGAPKVKKSQTITFGDTKSFEWIIGTDCTLEVAKQGPTVTGAQTTVSYQSSDRTIAMVDNDGKVTPLKKGTVTITATAEETEDYKEAKDSYSLKITDPNSGTVSKKNEYDFSFSTIGSEGWANSYAEHVVNFDEATVTFASHSKQTSTITNVPVGKGADVTMVLKNGTMSTAKFVCTQWRSKTQTITLHYSLDGGETYTSTGVTSSNFTISSEELPEGTNAVKITFSSSSNQVGVASAEFTHITDAE